LIQALKRSSGGQTRLPLKLLACWLVLALAAAYLPGSVSKQLKDRGRKMLAPGQRLAWSALRSLRRWGLVWQGRADSAEELIALRDRVERLEELNQALRARAAGQDFSRAADVEQPPPLVGVRVVEVRVIGRQAQRFLQQTAVIASDKSAELSRDSVALDRGEVLVDQGGNASLAASNVVASGARVWGKIVEVGPETAVIRRVNAIGYRGLVQIVNEVSGVRRPMAHGVLEGTGDLLCRIRMVDATVPISVGDLVLAADQQGLTDAPLIYGRITRAQLDSGAPHWQLWMTPAVADNLPATLTVLQPELNQERLAKRPGRLSPEP
jgi:hypothetical protein